MSKSEPTALPKLLAEIAEITSLCAALKVAQAKGGQSVWIPAKIANTDHWLAQAVGLEDAQKIATYYAVDGTGGNHIIPMATTGLRSRTWAQIQKMIDEGKSADKIAAATGVHRRTVFRRQKITHDFPLLDGLAMENKKDAE